MTKQKFVVAMKSNTKLDYGTPEYDNKNIQEVFKKKK